jgi:hypothetical protein
MSRVAEFRLPIFDCKQEKKMPDVDLTIGIRPVLRFFERAKLRSSAENAVHIFLLSVSTNRRRQIWRSHTCSDRSTRNFSLVIYVLRGFQARRKAAFEIVEVCRRITVIPNNGTTINEVRVARDTDYLAGFVNTVGLTVYVFWCTVSQRFEMSEAIFPGPHECV